MKSRHVNDDGTPRYTNRLSARNMPYLQQHAHNPVDWYPWGAEALARARAENKPIHAVSIGYSACHWCHVLAHESFEDEATAARVESSCSSTSRSIARSVPTSTASIRSRSRC